jgi:hypothetical protein
MTHKEIKKWLDKHNIENYTIRPDGVVDVNGYVDLCHFKEGILPVQFGKVTGKFDVSSSFLTSLKGAPEIVGGDFNCGGADITSLDGVPQYIGGYFSCYNTKVISLSGVDKRIKQINGEFFCVTGATHMLGILLIKGVTGIEFSYNNLSGRGTIGQIMNKYIGTGDILSAQDELIDAGFIDQARL